MLCSISTGVSAGNLKTSLASEMLVPALRPQRQPEPMELMAGMHRREAKAKELILVEPTCNFLTWLHQYVLLGPRIGRRLGPLLCYDFVKVEVFVGLL